MAIDPLLLQVLKGYMRQLQDRGDIPRDVSDAELDEVARQHSARLHKKINKFHRKHRDHLAKEGKLEDWYRELLRPLLGFPPWPEDQAVYEQRETGVLISPTWTHRACGGEVFMVKGSDHFACRRCHQSGTIGLDVPDELKTQEQKYLYVLNEASEVDLIPER
jgi:ribosomal protein S27AE